MNRITFWKKVEITETCWLWTGALGRGYGRVKINGRVHQAHRLVYETLVGPIPKGMQLDHLCREKRCVNPAHLEVVTQQENLRRGAHYERDKTHCDNGHRWDAENTVMRQGKRRCRACERDRWLRRKHAVVS